VRLSLSALDARAVVLDIEGTTTPVAFVYDVLFPFARAHAAGYLRQQSGSEACQAAVAMLYGEREADAARGEHPPEPVAAYVHWLMDRDRKSRGLKMLQGLIWQEGYRTGELRGQVYPDVRPALERWRARGVAPYIYSSGSVLAQQLLFRTTTAGDLTRFLHGHFDTEIGAKTSPGSYRRIVDSIGVRPAQIVFVSDVVAELDAARTAGLRTTLCVRSAEEAEPASNAHMIVHSFDEIVD
jgi:enolase-phosphatase E1